MFTLKRKLNLSESDLLELAQKESLKVGEIENKLLHWDFGPVMSMKFDPAAKNYLFSSGAVPFHWDGAFFKEPQTLLFYCTESEGEGGETLFVNTEKVWESLSDAEQKECEGITLNYETSKVAHYGGKITLPLVKKHPLTGKTILRMAEQVETELNPVSLKIEGTLDPKGFYDRMVKKLYEHSFHHQWQRGDLLLVDNHTFLHGRRPLLGNKTRSFKRIQIL
jgi:alpha-ketoglutarate-dependent taurine dioxygenase